MADQITGEITTKGDIDPFLAAVRQVLVDQQGELADFTAKNVIVVPPEMEDTEIDAAVQASIARHRGLALLITGGEARNPDPEAPGPRCTITMDLDLYVMPAKRPRGTPSALRLVAALMRGLHDAQIRVTGFPWYDEIRWLGYGPIPDEDFIAYSLSFEREMTLTP